VGAALLVGVAMTLTGCGGSSKKASAAGAQAGDNSAPAAASSRGESSGGNGGGNGGGKVASDGCVLSASEASTVIGGQYDKATPTGNGVCNYLPAASNTDAGKANFFTIVSSGSGDAAWKSQEATLIQDAGGNPIKISGVGDRAEAGGGELIAQGNGFIVDVHGELTEHSGDWSTYEAVAKAILAKV
jgi:hypothetical protein